MKNSLSIQFLILIFMVKLKILKIFLSTKKRDFRYKNLRIILKLYSNNRDMQ